MIVPIFITCFALFMQTTRAMDAPEPSGSRHNPLFNNTRKFDYLADTTREKIEVIISAYTHLDRLRKMGIKPPSPIALHGPPGAGKTFTAKAIAQALRIPYKKYNYEDMLVASMTKENQVSIVILLSRLREMFDQAEQMRSSPFMIIINNLDHLASFNNCLSDIVSARTTIKTRLRQEIKERAKRNMHFLVVCEHQQEPNSEDAFYKHRIAIATKNHEELFLSLVQSKNLIVDANLDLKAFKLITKTPAFLTEMVRICATKACARNETTLNLEDIRFAFSCLMPKPKLLPCNKHVADDNNSSEEGVPYSCRSMYA